MLYLIVLFYYFNHPLGRLFMFMFMLLVQLLLGSCPAGGDVRITSQ
jgi:hypothetical protein